MRQGHERVSLSHKGHGALRTLTTSPQRKRTVTSGHPQGVAPFV